jgi:hypothetical protein
VDLGKGMNVPDVCRRLGVSQQTLVQHCFCKSPVRA